MSGQLHAPAALPPGNCPPCQLYRRLGGSQSRSGRYGEERNLLPLPGIEPQFLNRSAHSLIAILTQQEKQNEFQNYFQCEDPKILVLCTVLLAAKNYNVISDLIYMFKKPNHSRPNLLLQFAKAGDITALVINDSHERHNGILMLSYKPQSLRNHTRLPFSVFYELCN
jgi:hypothetical protein